MLIIGTDTVRVGGSVFRAADFYAVRPNAPRLTTGITNVVHIPSRVTYMTDGETAHEYPGDPAELQAYLEEESAIAAAVAALP